MKRRDDRRGQSSVEFLVVTGIGLLMLTGVAMVYLSYTRGSSDSVRLQQVNAIGETILQQASRVYGLGSNSWISVDVSMPEGVQDVYTVENNTLVFDVSTSNGIVSQPVFSTIPIFGVNQSGVRWYITNGTVIHSGATRLRITSNGANVTIQATS